MTNYPRSTDLVARLADFEKRLYALERAASAAHINQYGPSTDIITFSGPVGNVANAAWIKRSVSVMVERVTYGTIVAASDGVTINVDGWYDCAGYVSYAAAAGTSRRIVRLVAAASAATGAGATFDAAHVIGAGEVVAVGTNAAINTSGTAYLTAGQHVRLETYQNSGGLVTSDLARLSVKRAG